MLRELNGCEYAGIYQQSMTDKEADQLSSIGCENGLKGRVNDHAVALPSHVDLAPAGLS